MRSPSLLAAELTAARRCQGLTQAEVAERAHVSTSTLSHWEIGRALPYADSLIGWAAALGYELRLQRPPINALLDELIDVLARALMEQDDD